MRRGENVQADFDIRRNIREFEYGSQSKERHEENPGMIPNQKNVLWIEGYCLIDTWKIISITTSAWSDLAREQYCEAQQDREQEVRNKSK